MSQAQDLALISEAFSFLDLENVEVRRYSGRGMRGTQCVGVVVSNLEAFVDVILTLKDLIDEDEVDPDSYISKVCQDDMGYQTVYYWPQIPYFEI